MLFGNRTSRNQFLLLWQSPIDTDKIVYSRGRGEHYTVYFIQIHLLWMLWHTVIVCRDAINLKAQLPESFGNYWQCKVGAWYEYTSTGLATEPRYYAV